MPFEISPQYVPAKTREQLGREALDAIARRIVEVDPKLVDMGVWCGTACCAIGHGMELPEVRATGLTHELMIAEDGRHLMSPSFEGINEPHEAIGAAFGIPTYISERLFAGGIRAPEGVAKAIRDYLAGGI